MGEFEVFEQAVEFAAVQSAPGTVKIISGLCLLPCVVVVQELNKDRSFTLEWDCVQELSVVSEFENPEEPVKSRDKSGSGLFFSCFNSAFRCSVEYLIKYTEFLLRLTLHVLSLGLKICAGRLFHCWREQEVDRKSLNQLSVLKKKIRFLQSLGEM